MGGRLVLAVSGGRDSMVLLHAAAVTRGSDIAMVASFDHGTGPAATRAADLVARECARMALPVVVERAGTPGRSEAEWRAARWRFLSRVARGLGGVVVTAHTRDDQVETVLMRVLRRAGARGLAGLYADSAIARPLLEFTRDEIAEYARAMGVSWVEDPSNDSPAFLRNRVRRDLLPALCTVHPELEEGLLDLARRAAELRRLVDGHAAGIAGASPAPDAVSVPVAALREQSGEALALLWPALASRVGLAMDWRGTERAAAFTNRSRPGSRIPLSGGWEIARTRDLFELRRAAKNGPGGELGRGSAPQQRGSRAARSAGSAVSL